MLRRPLLLSLVLLLAGCSLMQRLRESMPTRAPTFGSEEVAQPGKTAKPVDPVANVKLLRAPADWGELAREAALRMSQRASQIKELGSRTVYVNEPALPTPFARALRQFLQSDLTQMGLSVAQRKEKGEVWLDAEVQSVRMSSGLQIVVTMAISDGNRFLFRETDVYMVNQSDVRLYDESMLPQPPQPPAPPTPTKTMPVTGG